MARVAINFGELSPDQAPHVSPGLVTAEGVYPAVNGYRPIGDFTDIAVALSGTFLGGGSFISTDGTPRMIAGNATNLYSGSSGTWTSKIGSLSVASRWRFTQFGDDVVCVNGGAPIAYSASLDTAAALTGSPPTASFCATVRDFVVLGAANGVKNVVQWSQQGAVSGWAVGTALAGLQPIYAGGNIMGLTSGEVCYIIQRFQVVRMSFTGDDTDPWQFDAISTNDGCVAEGSIIQAGALFFMLTDRGFVMFDGAQFKPIGVERIDRTFKALYSTEDLQSIWASTDPENTLVIWTINGRAWIYNWVLDRWAVLDLNLMACFQAFSSGVSIDALDAIYGNLDAIPYSLDDARFSGGTPRLVFVDNDGVFGVLTGSNVAAQIALPFVEYARDRVARIRRVRPITDATDGITLTSDSRVRLGDAENEESWTQLNSRGDMPTRIAGRSVKLKLDIAAGTAWSFLQQVEAEFQAAGRQ